MRMVCMTPCRRTERTASSASREPGGAELTGHSCLALPLPLLRPSPSVSELSSLALRLAPRFPFQSTLFYLNFLRKSTHVQQGCSPPSPFAPSSLATPSRRLRPTLTISSSEHSTPSAPTRLPILQSFQARLLTTLSLGQFSPTASRFAGRRCRAFPPVTGVVC